MNMRVTRHSETPVHDPTSSNTRHAGRKGHKSEERDAETQNTGDGGQTTTASSPLMRQCCHHETVVDEMESVLPS